MYLAVVGFRERSIGREGRCAEDRSRSVVTTNSFRDPLNTCRKLLADALWPGSMLPSSGSAWRQGKPALLNT